MKQKINNTYITFFSLMLITLIASTACNPNENFGINGYNGTVYNFNPPADHNIPKLGNNDFFHAPDPYDPYGSLTAGLKSCTPCHGATNLRGEGGATAPSCLLCHQRFDAPADHTAATANRHGNGLYFPHTNCTSCHGVGGDIAGQVKTNGQTPPSCTKCHNDYWNMVPHTDSKGGALHAEGKKSPYPNCTGCHGGSLTGGVTLESGKTPPSCYSCHGKKW